MVREMIERMCMFAFGAGQAEGVTAASMWNVLWPELQTEGTF